ncbi:hypothetical protein Vadar_004638 [Vaccinium darrowii]|uniref:Uncharacterized protein n=1 Tax=Vaccinium darrowii TaxID=229202 RepID=A0ACB7XXI0_9ERIC|nr:hypothetical protein Vadar_004638 [Vaccinium darrowii]
MADRERRVRGGRGARGRGDARGGRALGGRFAARRPAAGRGGLNQIDRFPSTEAETKFSLFRNRNILFERQLDLSTTGIPEVTQWLNELNWGPLASIEGYVYLNLVREFYSNITHIDRNRETITSWVRGHVVTVTPTTLGRVVHLASLENYVYPVSRRDRRMLNVTTRDSIAVALTGETRDWGRAIHLTQRDLFSRFRVLNLFVCATVEPCSYTSHISASRGLLLQHHYNKSRFQ